MLVRERKASIAGLLIEDVKLLNFTNMKKSSTIKSFLKKCIAEAGKTEMQTWGYKL